MHANMYTRILFGAATATLASPEITNAPTDSYVLHCAPHIRHHLVVLCARRTGLHASACCNG